MPRKVGTPWKIEISGQKFGKWLVLHRVAGSMWLCRCECGAETAVPGSMLKLGKSTMCKSCASTKHGMEGTRTYNIWAGMKQRCQNENYHGYSMYGGRGISVCTDWKSFDRFFRDMGKAPKGKSLGRIDNDGKYEKANCRWETPKQQIRNRGNTRFVTFRGERKSLAEWAERTGIPLNVLKQRYLRKWPAAKLLSPTRAYKGD